MTSTAPDAAAASSSCPAPRPSPAPSPAPSASDAWWRTAVVYQVYVRSFRGSTGNGMGDLGGVLERLPYLRRLGVDAVWLSPFYPSPQHDHGYDVVDYHDVDPRFGDLDLMRRIIDRAHALGLRLVVDIVSNHCSIEHPWFRAALAAEPGSPERALFHFADGRGPDGAEPPNNWRSIFGGSSWVRTTAADGTPGGQWYLHSFAPEQADFNWADPRVGDYFDSVLRFWLDLGVDGFRIDVVHGLHKQRGLPDDPRAALDETTGDPVNAAAWNRPEVHDVWRDRRPRPAPTRPLPAARRTPPELVLRVPAHRLGRGGLPRRHRPRPGRDHRLRLGGELGPQQPRHAARRDPVRGG